MEDHSRRALRHARRLRGELSLPEVLLWRSLRQRPHGVKFRRQHPVGDYVVDFYCAERRLVVEVDGIAHDMGDRPERDATREAWLRSRGFEVIRIRARDVLADASAVAESLVAVCSDPPPSALRAATSPRGGGFLESR